MSELRYSFEKTCLEDQKRYQVRLKGEFVCYTDKKDSAFVDALLRENGYPSREAFLQRSYPS